MQSSANQMKKMGKHPNYYDFGRKWIRGWSKEYSISLKHLNKSFSITQNEHKKRVISLQLKLSLKFIKSLNYNKSSCIIFVLNCFKYFPVYILRHFSQNSPTIKKFELCQNGQVFTKISNVKMFQYSQIVFIKSITQ